MPIGTELKAFFGCTGNEIFQLGWYTGPDTGAPRSPPSGCKVSSVSGTWAYRETLAVPANKIFKHGTTKTDSTKEWSESAITTMKQGWNFVGEKGSIFVSGQVAHSTSSSYAHEFSATEESDLVVHFTNEQVGKSVYQFVFTTYYACTDNGVVKSLNAWNTLVIEYALTEGKWRPPCCVPGYSTDAPKYLTCHSKETMVKDGEQFGCKVANSEL